MKTHTILLLALFFAAAPFTALTNGYEVGDSATDFRLKNVDGNMVSLSDYPDASGFIVIFTCNHCPYSIAYEDRIIELDEKYRPHGFPVIAINPNDPDVQPADSFEKMQERAEEKGFTFPYLLDEGQTVYPQYGATRTPHVFVLEKAGGDLIVRYIGAIDNNHSDPAAADAPFVAMAIDALLAGGTPEPDFTKAIGCTIKTKKK